MRIEHCADPDDGTGDGTEPSDPVAIPAQPALAPGRNCWRIERAEKASVIVDAEDYFALARPAMLAARRRIMLVGWDFDSRIRIGPEQIEDGGPETIGDFMLWLVEQQPELEIYLLRWDIGAIKAAFRGSTPVTLLRWALHDRIHVKLDSMHPAGASHHQKIVVVDDCFAFCGGIDMTAGRWDRRTHRDGDPERLGPNGKLYGPWHDATMALEGPAAAALGELARQRWQAAGGATLAPVERKESCWPKPLEVQFARIDVAISRTQPKHARIEEAHEIEQLYLDLIARAKRHIYAESQYFASRKAAEAIARRLDEPDGPEILLLNPEQADGWLEQEAMDTARARLHEALKRRDNHGRFRLFHPFTSGGAPIYVHAKIMVIDDQVLRVGSSNLNNRSLRLDTECDITIDATLPGNADVAARIAAIRDDLIAEHLGVEPDQVTRLMARTGSLIRTVDRLQGSGKTLRAYRPPTLGEVEKYLADHEVLDPEGPDEMFEPMTKRHLLRRLPKLSRAANRRRS